MPAPPFAGDGIIDNLVFIDRMCLAAKGGYCHCVVLPGTFSMALACYFSGLVVCLFSIACSFRHLLLIPAFFYKCG